jgi:hypothetical protein
MNATKLPLFALCAGAALAAAAADVCYEGRLLDASGAVRANETIAATLRAYETEDAAESAAFAAVPLAIATDEDGLFAATAAVDPPAGLDSFWIGVAPEGGAEIRPRMRVLPAPFAIVAASAELLESEGTLRLPGAVTVRKLEDDADVTATNATLQGRTTLRGDVTGAKNVYIRDLDVGDGRLSMLRTARPDGISTRWDEFAADVTLDVATTLFSTDHSDSTTVVAIEDGFAMVMIQAEDKSGYHSYAEAALSTGDFRIFGWTRFLEKEGTVTRLFTFPVRRQSPVTLELRVHHGRLRNPVRMKAKIKLVYFGAN